MKRLTTIVALSITIILCACAGNKEQQGSAQQNNSEKMEKKTTLVAYFSATGTTKAAAVKLAEVVNADIHEIQPKQPYTDADLDWHNQQSRSSVEMKDKSSRPAIKNKVENMDQYNTVYIGYPIWWYIAPTIINTFVEQYNLEGKTNNLLKLNISIIARSINKLLFAFLSFHLFILYLHNGTDQRY